MLLGRRKDKWQDRDYVLKWFGGKEGEAKKAYRDFVKRGIDQGRRSDLVGGGLIRSQGGWSAVKTMRRLGVREKSDERILGSGDFIEQLIQQSDRTRREQFADQGRIQRAALLVEKVCKNEKVSVEALRAGSRRQNVSKVRAQLAKKLVEEGGFLLVEAGRHLGVSASAVAKILSRQDEYKYR